MRPLLVLSLLLSLLFVGALGEGDDDAAGDPDADDDTNEDAEDEDGDNADGSDESNDKSTEAPPADTSTQGSTAATMVACPALLLVTAAIKYHQL